MTSQTLSAMNMTGVSSHIYEDAIIFSPKRPMQFMRNTESGLTACSPKSSFQGTFKLMLYLNLQTYSAFQFNLIQSSLGSWVKDERLGEGGMCKGEGAWQHVVDGQGRGEA